jgi:hypothetical protein
MLPNQSAIHGTKSQVRLQFCVESTDRTGCEGYCPLAVALEQVLHEKHVTATHAVCATRHSCTTSGLFHETWRVLVDRLACTACKTSSSFYTLCQPWSICTGGMNAPALLRLQCTIAAIWSGYLCWYLLSATLAFYIMKDIPKCISAYSTLVNHTILFCCFHQWM